MPRRIWTAMLFATLAPCALALAADAPPTPPTPAPETRPNAAGNGAGAGALLERFVGKLDSLNLTPDQKTKIDALVDKAKEDFKALQADSQNLEPREKLQKFGARFKQLKEDIAAVLDPSQKEQFEKLTPAAGQGGGAGAGAGAGAGNIVQRIKEAIDKLDLTPEQKPKVEAVLEDLKTKMADLRAQVQSGTSRDEIRQKAQAIREESRAKLMEILTPEQQAKLHELMQPQGGAPGQAPSQSPGQTPPQK